MTEKRIRWLLVGVLVGQLMLLSAQVRSEDRNYSVLEASMLRLVAPLVRAVDGSAAAVSSLRGRFETRKALREDNEKLRGELEAMRRDRVETFGLEQKLELLSKAASYAQSSGSPPRVADVVLLDYGSWQQTLMLYVGDQGVERQQPVVTDAGLVGRVVVAAGRYAKVQMITDRSASVGAMIERTRRQGIVRGGERSFLGMDFVPLQEVVKVGDRVLTAGIDGVYPRGIPVGTVVSVRPGGELFHRISLVPAVDLGRLDQVFLLQAERVPPDLQTIDDASR
ncbi:MAG: rod shape-determining protein MreC [Acidobacteria bacterium]|nr:rod shape-determining protein MreC [Acidobacteriota bacterium]